MFASFSFVHMPLLTKTSGQKVRQPNFSHVIFAICTRIKEMPKKWAKEVQVLCPSAQKAEGVCFPFEEISNKLFRLRTSGDHFLHLIGLVIRSANNVLLN